MFAQITVFALTGLVLISPTEAIVRPNNLGKLPALGFNTYNAYKCANNEADLISAANSMISLGLKSLGYEYVNVDDCWSVKGGRDSKTGLLVPDSTKFPDGINGTATKLHALGFKFGIYSSKFLILCP
jgi:alpha-galactosidase